MNPDGRDGQVPYAPESRKGGAWMGAMVVIVLLYFMSPIFVAKALVMCGATAKSPFSRGFRIFYTPSIALYDRWKPYQKLIDAEIKWLGVH